MALILDEEQQMLKDSASDFLQSQAPVSHLRELRDSGDVQGFSSELWQEIVEMGWSAVLVPEEFGGLGYGYVGLGLILEQCGRTLTPSPLASTALAGVTALLRAGSAEQKASMMPAIASGELLVALAIDESAHHEPRTCTTRAEKTADGYRLSGSKTTVVDGNAANSLIVSASSGDDSEITLFLVQADATGVGIEPMATLDIHHSARVTFDDVVVDATAVLGDVGAGGAHLDYILDVARIGQSAEMLGLAQEAFERTLEYLKERKQFGLPIGSFQGLQHRAAEMFGELEMCKSAVLNALMALDENRDEIAEIASMTKAKLAETAHNVAAEGIQMHGGIGMTDEYEIGFFLKRCRILETIYGDRYFHLDRFASLRGY